MCLLQGSAVSESRRDWNNRVDLISMCVTMLLMEGRPCIQAAPLVWTSPWIVPSGIFPPWNRAVWMKVTFNSVLGFACCWLPCWEAARGLGGNCIHPVASACAKLMHISHGVPQAATLTAHTAEYWEVCGGMRELGRAKLFLKSLTGRCGTRHKISKEEPEFLLFLTSVTFSRRCNRSQHPATECACKTAVSP